MTEHHRIALIVDLDLETAAHPGIAVLARQWLNHTTSHIRHDHPTAIAVRFDIDGWPYLMPFHHDDPR